MEISGQELPSIRFTPEVSVGASLTNPEASGGVAFEDRNFLGMGQKVEFAVAKKEGQQAGLAELPPSITAKVCHCIVVSWCHYVVVSLCYGQSLNSCLPPIQFPLTVTFNPAPLPLQWSDSNVGRPSKVSVGFNEQHTFLPALDQVWLCHLYNLYNLFTSTAPAVPHRTTPLALRY